MRRDKDFASAAMMRLVNAGAQIHGFRTMSRRSVGSKVEIECKRAALKHLVKNHGLISLLKVVEAARQIPLEPVARALTGARNLDDLLERWMRLERFSHSCHIVKIEKLDKNSCKLHHLNKFSDSRPSLNETLLVFGLLTVLAEMVCDKDAGLTTASGRKIRQNGSWIKTDFSEISRGIVLSIGSEQKPNQPRKIDVFEPELQIRDIVSQDLLNRWSLRCVSRQLSVSPRTLQRRLARNSTSFSNVIMRSRLETATKYLCQTKGPSLAEIGFLTGFSDQAHFSRTFRREVGTTPQSFRDDFSSSETTKVKQQKRA